MGYAGVELGYIGVVVLVLVKSSVTELWKIRFEGPEMRGPDTEVPDCVPWGRS